MFVPSVHLTSRERCSVMFVGSWPMDAFIPIKLAVELSRQDGVDCPTMNMTDFTVTIIGVRVYMK